ncbi:MAG: 23S rRNA (adenine(2503)-C(2))-methyltransferase RlmN [Acidimicrobiales bacterium]
MISPWTPDRDELAAGLAGEPRYRIDQLWRGLYTEGLGPADITSLPKTLRQHLGRHYQPELHPSRTQSSRDGSTEKWLFSMADGTAVETVLMHYPQRSTVCVSSQAGCAMACAFCATGQAGYRRNLTVGQILEQVMAARAAARPRRVSNVVFMGMGEPLANYDRVVTAVHRLIDDVGLAARHITVSTIGLVPRIDQLAGERLQIGLAVSLHAADDETRSRLVPINRRHPIPELMAACRRYRDQTGRRVSLEWAMIDGVNDRPVDAERLAGLARSARAHVNLIPLNPTPGWPTVGSPPERIAGFADRLRADGVNVTVRANRGVDIDAACGQLATGHRATPVAVTSTTPAG